MVYDLGGGTFDVTIMRIEEDNFRVIASDGDYQLGGKDFDDALMRFAVEKFTKEHGFDLTTDPIIAGELRIHAEKAKRELSKLEKTTMILRARDKTSRIEITRNQYESLIKPKLDTTLSMVRSALKDAHLDSRQIDRILLIGGSTRTPAVKRILRTFFEKEPDASVNPDEAVALGAALIAAKKIVDVAPNTVAAPIVEKVGELEITEVTSHSLGIEAVVPGTQQRINTIIIPRQRPIPTEESKEFITTTPGATSIAVKIYQGEFQDPALCNLIGEFRLSGLPPNRPAGKKVRVTVSYAPNGVIHVTALDIETGQETTTQVSYKIGPSTEEKSAKQMWLDSLQVQ
jgi:molecular chaperone DnaK